MNREEFKRNFPDWFWLITGICVLISVMAIYAMIKGPAENNDIYKHLENVKVNAQMQVKDTKENVVLLANSESNNINYMKQEQALCLVKDFKNYPLKKDFKEFDCNYKKSLARKEINIINQVQQGGMGE